MCIRLYNIGVYENNTLYVDVVKIMIASLLYNVTTVPPKIININNSKNEYNNKIYIYIYILVHYIKKNILVYFFIKIWIII